MRKGANAVEILVVGSLNMDLVFNVTKLPRLGETVAGSGFLSIPGGKGANQAVAAARLGAAVGIIGRVGQDDYGATLIANLAANGVNTGHLQRTAASPTGLACITVAENGANTIVVYPGANRQCGAEDVEAIGSVRPRALIAQLEIPLTTVCRAFHIAREGAVLTALNPSPIRPLPPSLLRETDLLIVNEVEAEALAESAVTDTQSALAAARKLRRLGPERCVVTLGEKGAVYDGPEGELYQPAFPVQAVDTTAAGDSFAAALLTSLLHDNDIRLAMRFAAAVGALTATRLGAQSSLPRRTEVESFLAAQP